MVTTRNPIKTYEEFGLDRGLVKPVKVAGKTRGLSMVPVAEKANKQIFTLANLRALGAINDASDNPDYIEVYMEEEVSSVEVDPSLLEEAKAAERAPKDSWIRVIPAKEVDQIYGSEVKPFGFLETEDSRIDFGAVLEPQNELDTVETAFFGNEGLAPVVEKEGFGDIAEKFFADEGKSVESAKLRGATARKAASLETTVEQSAPYSSMSNKNIGTYDVQSMQKNILYDFVERNAAELGKASGITGIFKRRSLKKKLDDLTRTAALWHLNDANSAMMHNDYAKIHEGVMETFDTLVSNKKLVSAYKAGNAVDAAKEAVDVALMKYAGPLGTIHVDRSAFDAIGAKYAQQTVAEPVTPSAEEAADYQQTPSRRFFARAAAVAGLVASVFTIGAPAVDQYVSATIADDSNIAVADKADDMFVSYAVESPEFPNAETPVEEPAPRPRRARRAAPAQAEVPQYAPDAHTNPRAYDVGQITLANQNTAVDDGELVETAAPQFRTHEGARLAALASGTPEYDFDDSNLRLAPEGEGHDYSRGAEFRPWTAYK